MLACQYLYQRADVCVEVGDILLGQPRVCRMVSDICPLVKHTGRYVSYLYTLLRMVLHRQGDALKFLSTANWPLIIAQWS
jgi:hypothetical protein